MYIAVFHAAKLRYSIFPFCSAFLFVFFSHRLKSLLRVCTKHLSWKAGSACCPWETMRSTPGENYGCACLFSVARLSVKNNWRQTLCFQNNLQRRFKHNAQRIIFKCLQVWPGLWQHLFPAIISEQRGLGKAPKDSVKVMWISEVY